jgi:hypothetical protein
VVEVGAVCGDAYGAAGAGVSENLTAGDTRQHDRQAGTAPPTCEQLSRTASEPTGKTADSWLAWLVSSPATGCWDALAGA